MHDLEEKPQYPSEDSSGTTADHAVNRNLQDESPRGITKRFSFVLDEPSEMMEKEAWSSEDFKTLAAVKQDRNFTRTSNPETRSRRRRWIKT